MRGSRCVLLKMWYAFWASPPSILNHLKENKNNLQVLLSWPENVQGFLSLL